MVKKCLVPAALTMLAIAASGCLPLMVGSLGYEGYEYTKTGTLPGMPAMPSSSSGAPPQAASTPSANDLE